MKTIILVPYVASEEETSVPVAEAKFFYEEHFQDAEVVQIVGSGLEGRLYVKDEIGLYIIGEGKTNAALNCTALLRDSRFDFSETKFILCGCCGSAYGRGVVGDIYLISECIDMDLGHHIDVRDTKNSEGQTWYPNDSFSRFGYINLENKFFEKAYDQLKNEKPKTTENAKAFMAKTFNNEDWAMRDPKIMKGASVTSDAYWKGMHDHEIADKISAYYKYHFPYMATQMEDIAVAQVFKQHSRLDDLLIIRFSVNMDVFMCGQTPETLWGEDEPAFGSSGFDSFDDLFPVATKCATDITWKIINS